MSDKDVGAAELLQELQQIRKLLIFTLIKGGSSQADIASALGVNQSSISRMFPKIAARNGRNEKK